MTYLLSHKVGLIVCFFAFFACLISCLFVGNYLFNVVENDSKLTNIQNRWRLTWSALICGALFVLSLWLTTQIARV